MEIKVTCRHCKLSDEIKEYVERKHERLIKRFERLHGTEVVLSSEGNKTRVEMICGTVRGKELVAEEVHEDAFAAIDMVMDKMERQVRRMKDRLKEHHPRNTEEQE